MATVLRRQTEPITERGELTEECWRAVVGFEGRYEVSSAGRVWSLVTKRLLRPGPTSRGYLSVQLYYDCKPKRSKSFCVHDLVTSAFFGPKPPGYQVDHCDANKRNNRIENLDYVTCLENNRRAIAMGLGSRAYGADSHNAKLTNEQVKEIRAAAHLEGFDAKRCGKRYGVCRDTIYSIVKNRTYKNVN